MKAIILLSGGIDSTVALALALEKNRHCHALSFEYGQRHHIEIDFAKKIAAHYAVSHRIIRIDPAPFLTSSLLSNETVPKDRSPEQIARAGIPSTYVPARNTLLMSYALGMAEVLEAQEIYIGSNVMDHNPYPDCRPEFFKALQNLFALATKQAVEGRPPIPVTPLLYWDKTEIVKQGRRLNVPFDLTFSCYDPTLEGLHCHHCDACQIRFAALKSLSFPSYPSDQKTCQY